MFSVHIGADQVFASLDYAEYDAVPEVAEVTQLFEIDLLTRHKSCFSEFIVHLCCTTPRSTPAYK